jgi:hypothetical protein
MAKAPGLDVKAAHKYFAAHCFNKAWDLIDKKERTADEDHEMLALSMASAWHWTQREDCTQQNMSVAYWQLARVFALLKQPDNARRYGQMSLQASQGGDIAPFYLGYSYEALARAEMVAGDAAKMAEYLAEARRAADDVKDAESKKLLLDDLATITL